MISDLEPIMFGRLNLSIEQAENYTISEVTTLISGWEQRLEDQRILMAMYCAMPTYQTQCKKPPKLEDLVPSIKKNKKDIYSDLSIEELRALASDDEFNSSEP